MNGTSSESAIGFLFRSSVKNASNFLPGVSSGKEPSIIRLEKHILFGHFLLKKGWEQFG